MAYHQMNFKLLKFIFESIESIYLKTFFNIDLLVIKVTSVNIFVKIPFLYTVDQGWILNLQGGTRWLVSVVILFFTTASGMTLIWIQVLYFLSFFFLKFSFTSLSRLF